MTLDIHADVFDDDLNAVSDRIDAAYERSGLGKLWAIHASSPARTER
jgi:hypothetical protein